MESNASSSSTPRDFGFAFNVRNFSDRILHIEIMDRSSPSSNISSNADQQCSSIHRKKRRVDIIHTVSCNLSDGDHGLKAESEDEENNETLNSDESNWGTDFLTVVRVKNLFISSPILASKSPFFLKLFSNGMQESDQRCVKLRIDASEEAAVMELLKFIYSNTLSVAEAPALLDILIIADKFEVESCMKYCSKLLIKLPMTLESALQYIHLPSTVLMSEATLPLIEAAKKFLATCYRDLTTYEQEVMELPLAGIEAVLSSDDLRVASEDVVYNFVMKWAWKNYPKLEKRREILETRLIRYIRFPFMTGHKLKKVLACSDIDHDIISKLVLEALFFKTEAPHRQRSIAAAEELVATTRRFSERAYMYKPVKVVEFEQPQHQCVVYLDLKREECANLYPSRRILSQGFYVGSQVFVLSAGCVMEQQVSFCFGLLVRLKDGSVSLDVDFEFATRSKPSREYMRKYKGSYTFTGDKVAGNINLFRIPWCSFMADDSPFFINGTLYLRAEITIRQ